MVSPYTFADVGFLVVVEFTKLEKGVKGGLINDGRVDFDLGIFWYTSS